MPVKVRKRGTKYRIVEPTGGIARSKHGKARDGGGHKSKAKAARQAGYINSGE